MKCRRCGAEDLCKTDIINIEGTMYCVECVHEVLDNQVAKED